MHSRNILKNTKGFTLVELIIVIAILGVLAAVATVSIVGIGNKSRITVVKTELTKYKDAYDARIADTGEDDTEEGFLNYIDPKVAGSNYKISSGIVPTCNWTDKTITITIKNITGQINLETGTIICPV